MTKLRINFGSKDWEVGMSFGDFEKLYNSGDEFITLPILFMEQPYSTMRVRPEVIRYYYEEL